MIQFRPPSMRETTPAGQINELRRYLFQLVEQLNYAFNNLEQKTEGISINSNEDIPGGDESINASDIKYDGELSGISSDNVQSAIDELKNIVDSKMTDGTADMEEGDDLASGTFYAVYEDGE